ncbi:MAG: hypothetical protein R3B70_31610 [Polyangiaceae bacterium]
MRAHFLLPATLLFALTTTGCIDYLSDSKRFLDGTGGTSGTGGTGGDGGTGGTGTTTTSSVPLECLPSGTSNAVDNMCGVFVSPNGNDDTGDGTKENPYATISKGLDKGVTVYACADKDKPFAEAARVTSAGTYLFGALDCETWIYDASNKTPLTAPPGEIPLTVLGTGTLRIEDFRVTSADAPALDMGTYSVGNSSIAVLAEAGSSLDMARCDVTAGNGSDGAPGEPPTGTAMAGPDGTMGADGCDNDQGEFGADGGQNMCAGMSVAGGQGGNGTKLVAGGQGGDGNPLGMTAKGGFAITGQITCDTGGNGGNGVAGTAGEAGKGATAAAGTLSSTGVDGIRGSDGTGGKPGQGGGGGGGAPICSNGKAGPSGGGGGAGGCGGAGGKGGFAGGASIGILSLSASLKFEQVTVTTGAGGKGGAGASGQDPGDGGKGGLAGASGGDVGALACSGGKGGAGGKGGRGGGGQGGHSFGLAYTGDVPETSGAMITPGTAGEGGTGEMPDGTGSKGIDKDVQGF